MGEFRRVVTGLSSKNAHTVISDAESPRVLVMNKANGEHWCSIAWMWSNDDIPQLPTVDYNPLLDGGQWFPGPRGTRFIIEVMAPGFGVNDDEELAGENSQRLAEFGIAFNGAHQVGTVHSSNTIDYAIVISGQIWLETEDGTEVCLGPGDSVVQNGVRHSWRNRGSVPCRIAFIMVGATGSTES